eukprot:TRINITY_DN48_c0_g1_i1.p1 TRINITY_DN48_c0_g1~~TRINITY_DN48_c0_g1_i1.p1  ORF type:complete len:105 (+),score=26.05 TRINITY_DN48_c0_g1_i1:146-460(+)
MPQSGKSVAKSKNVRGGSTKRNKNLKKGPKSITKGSIRRIARRGGCRRLAGSVYDEARDILTTFVGNVMNDTAALLEMTGRKTVRASDILFALKKQGRTLYAVA